LQEDTCFDCPKYERLPKQKLVDTRVSYDPDEIEGSTSPLGDFLGKARDEGRVREALCVVEDVHDKGGGGGVSHVGGIGGVGVEVPPVRKPRVRLKTSAMQDPESPLAENAPECLSVGMIGHSLDSWYCPAK
jgi:hypothetical protein